MTGILTLLPLRTAHGKAPDADAADDAHWIWYPGSGPDGKELWVLFNRDLHDSMDRVPPNVVLVDLKFLSADKRGFPSQGELQEIHDFETALAKEAAKHKAVYAGYSSHNGSRTFVIYTKDQEADWKTRVETLAREYKFSVGLRWKQDPQHKVYLENLYPDADSWQVIGDLQVLKRLEAEDDVTTQPREVEHWAYFAEKNAASNFRAWAKERGYKVESPDPPEEGKYCVRYKHTGTMVLSDITSHSISSGRKARELGGEYDGWETSVCRKR